MWNCNQWSNLSGGAAIESAAKSGDPTRFTISEPLLHTRDCNFSFAGIKNSARRAIIQEEIDHGKMLNLELTSSSSFVVIHYYTYDLVFMYLNLFHHMLF